MIVSDSTALITLINIEEFELLGFFTQKVLIPKEVYEEVALLEEARVFLDVKIEKKFIEVSMYDNQLLHDKLCILLDSGESASIALALEKNIPLLIDEKKGRNVAANMGVKIIGLIGIIRFLYKKEKISKKRTQEILEKLSASSFRVSKKLMDMVLE
jgi:predicted nucleic acid-binding protein